MSPPPAAEPPLRSSLRLRAGVIPSARVSLWGASSSSPTTSFEGPVPALRVDGHLHGIFADVQVDEVPGVCGGIEHRAPRPPHGLRRACRCGRRGRLLPRLPQAARPRAWPRKSSAAGAVSAASVGSAGVRGTGRERGRTRGARGGASFLGLGLHFVLSPSLSLWLEILRLEALFGIPSSLFVRLFAHKYLTTLGLSASPAHVSTADAARYVGVRGVRPVGIGPSWMDG
ncbi:hypothetical protein C8R45DRAFT_1113772 [Mycena sanguinolenta]|nr:hypothetical protein C8R45DRAFT_1113772 [Mycena sanguinolenta]